jgi:UDP-N-acetylglucosamine diphosphorylase/glucosamine-1-phosphate N-acetyltransferase
MNLKPVYLAFFLICIFEDEQHINFYPLTYSRTVYDLVCGIKSLRQKISREFSSEKITLHCRNYLKDTVKLQNPDVDVNFIKDDSCLFINGRAIVDEKFSEMVKVEGLDDCVFINGNEIIAFKLSGPNLEKVKNNFPDTINSDSVPKLPSKNVSVKTYNYLWDLIRENGSEIVKDIDHLKKENLEFVDSKKFNGINIINNEEVLISKNVIIKPGVVIDASNGPVYIDEYAFIYPNAVIEGPVCIGESAKIKAGASIYENVSIGKLCKIGGEVEDSVILSYSNKQHAGFIGHSYLGSWVNLGADTNCSDLKNNYSTVKVQLNGKAVDTESQLLGVIIGDHSKTAINTMFNTGTVVGFSCNIFGAGFPDKYIPSFSWGGSESLSTYDLDKSIATAKIVLNRRDEKFLPANEELFVNIFNLTSEERNEQQN